MAKRKSTPHASHKRVVNVPGAVRNGSVVKPYVKRWPTLPAGYDPSYCAGAGVVPNSGETPGYNNGGDPMSGMQW